MSDESYLKKYAGPSRGEENINFSKTRSRPRIHSVQWRVAVHPRSRRPEFLGGSAASVAVTARSARRLEFERVLSDLSCLQHTKPNPESVWFMAPLAKTNRLTNLAPTSSRIYIDGRTKQLHIV